MPPAAFLTEEHRHRINTLFNWLVDPCMAFIRKNCKELVRTWPEYGDPTS